MAAAEPHDGPSIDPERPPTVICSHVDVVYKVYGGGGARRTASEGRLSQWVDRGRRHMGVREVHAVKDVSFVAYQGESIGLVGRNGSGKSTLLRAIAGLVPADNGHIYHRGQAALLGVNAAMNRKLSGARNIFIGGQALGLTRSQVRAKYRDIVRFADIGEFVNLPMSSYSSGMGARLRFAVSTAAVPDILVVDEALGTGDAEFREKAAARIEEIKSSAGTVFMVNHNNAAIKAQCDRVLWMERGELRMDGPAAEVVDAYVAFIAAEKAKKARKGRRPRKATPAPEDTPEDTPSDGPPDTLSDGPA